MGEEHDAVSFLWEIIFYIFFLGINVKDIFSWMVSCGMGFPGLFCASKCDIEKLHYCIEFELKCIFDGSTSKTKIYVSLNNLNINCTLIT